MTVTGVATDRGTIVEVRVETLGDELATAAVPGAATLTVVDVVDFDEDGGSLAIGSEVLGYTGIDDETGVITLDPATPLVGSYPVEEPVWLSPEAQSKTAQVMVGDFDEAVEATVPHTLWDRIPEGIRADGSGEVVDLELVGTEFVITEVVSAEPVIDGSLLDSTIPLDPAIVPPAEPPPASDGFAPASSPAVDVTSPLDGQLRMTWPAVVNNDPVTYLVYLSTTTPVPITAGNLLAETTDLSLTTGLRPDGTALVRGTRYYSRVVASDRDGPAATAGTEDSAIVAGALVAPTATPVPDPHGNVREILLRLPPVSNATPSQVQVYVSTTSPVVLDSNHLHGLAEGTLYSIAALPAGLGGTALTSLAEGTPIYIVVRTVNAAGTGPASSEVSASLHKVDAADFAVGYLYAGEVDVGQLRGDTFQLGTGTVNEVAAEGVNGERVALAADGFTVRGPTSAGNPIYVDFPTDGSKPNIFSGTVEANTLEVLNGATLRSLFNMIAAQGRLTLSSGVMAPQSPPATKIDWPTVNVDTTTKRSSGGANNWGSFAFDPTAVTAMCWDGTRWLVAQNCTDPGTGYQVSRIWTVSATGVTGVYSDTDMRVSGISWVGGKLYGVGFLDAFVPVYGADVRWLSEIQASGAVVNTQIYTRNNDTQEPTLGTDGTNILLAEVTPVTQVVRVKTFATTNLATPSATLTSSDLVSPNQLAGVARGTFDYGATRIVTAAKGGSVTDFWTMDTIGVSLPNEAWPSAAAVLKAFGWDGTNFWGLGSGGQLFKHTTLKWTTESSKWWVGYTWADTNTTSSRTASITTNTTAGTQKTITAATAVFTAADVGSVITGTGIPAATTIVSVESSTSATMSVNATAAATITATIFSAAHETNLSAKSSFTMKKRAQVTVTTTAIPTGTAADDPNSLSIYLGRGAGTGSPLDLDRTLMYRQSTGLTTFTTFAPQFSVDASHPNPPLANNFPATAPGGLVAGLNGFNVDGNSNGSVGAGTFRDSVDARVAAKVKGGTATASVVGTNGLATFSHSLGVTPSAVVVTPTTNATVRQWRVTAKTSTTFEVQSRDTTGAVLAAGVSLTFDYIAYA